eukprot:gene4106-4663_t
MEGCQNDSVDGAKRHHQITKAFAKRQQELVRKMVTQLEANEELFIKTKDSSLYNFITKSEVQEVHRKDILTCESIGQAKYSEFLEERMTEDSTKGIWEPLKMLNREFDMKEMIVTYELQIVPRSLMLSDGNLHPGHEVIVQKIAPKSSWVKTVEDISKILLGQVDLVSRKASEIHLVLDTYKDDSLKQNTHMKRKGYQKAINFRIADKRNIQKISMTKLLSSERTKQSLTEYLAKKATNHFEKKQNLKFLVSANGDTVGCDKTGKFYGKGKGYWFNAFMKLEDETISAICSLQNRPIGSPTEIEKFIVPAYGPKTNAISTLAEARWYLFCKNPEDCEKLPPISDAFQQHLLRAQLQAIVW